MNFALAKSPRLARSPRADPEARETQIVPVARQRCKQSGFTWRTRPARRRVGAIPPATHSSRIFAANASMFPESFASRVGPRRKSRFFADWAHTTRSRFSASTTNHSLLCRIAIRKKLLQNLSSKLRKAHALAVSDYGFGVARLSSCKQATRKRRNGLQVTLDARYQLHAYAKAGISAATPNEAELESQLTPRSDEPIEELARVGSATLATMKLQSLLVTEAPWRRTLRSR